MTGTLTRPDDDRTATGALTAAAVLLDALTERTEHLLAQEPRIREHAPDAVAAMRIDTRELRCILTGFRRCLDRARTDPIVADLKWLGAELADERDTEVMAERFAQVLDALPHELVRGPVAADLDEHLGQRVEENTRRILVTVNSARYAGLRQQLDELLTDPPFTERAGRAAREELPRGVAKAHRQLDQMICSALRVEHELERADALHEARKAAKRVHYMCEVAVPAVGKPAKRLRRTMRKLQGMLGEHQDAAVARPTLHCLGLQADRHGHSAFTYGVLYAAEHFRARDVERALPTLVELLRAPDATNWLDPAWNGQQSGTAR
jgi:CHAD domain-containing protein